MSWLDKVKEHGEKVARKPRANAPAKPCPPVQEIIITVRQSSENDPGEIAIGYFTVENGAVTLVDEKGAALGKSVEHGDRDPHSIAAVLMRSRWEETRGGFNRRLDYPSVRRA